MGVSSHKQEDTESGKFFSARLLSSLHQRSQLCLWCQGLFDCNRTLINTSVTTEVKQQALLDQPATFSPVENVEKG